MEDSTEISIEIKVVKCFKENILLLIGSFLYCFDFVKSTFSCGYKDTNPLNKHLRRGFAPNKLFFSFSFFVEYFLGNKLLYEY